MILAKIFNKEYLEYNFYLFEGYYYLDEEQAMRNKITPVFEYLPEDDAGKVIKTDNIGYFVDYFVDYYLTKEQYPEYFL